MSRNVRPVAYEGWFGIDIRDGRSSTLTRACETAELKSDDGERIATETDDATHDSIATKADPREVEQRLIVRFANFGMRFGALGGRIDRWIRPGAPVVVAGLRFGSAARPRWSRGCSGTLLMNWFTGALLYVLVWWVTLFAVLPLWVVPTEPGELGHAAGAPKQPLLLRKVVVTSLVAAVIWVGIYALVRSPWLSFRGS